MSDKPSTSVPKKVPNTIWDVLEATCTTKQIQSLLQLAKLKSEGVVISGATKADVVKSVRELVSDGKLSEVHVSNIIRDHEENGNQHIFFFAPANTKERERLSDGKRIAQQLLGSELPNLPQYQTIPNEYTWADFRYDTNRWTAKVYGHQVRIKFERAEEKPHTIIRIYRKVERRVVCLAQWDGTYLQMRISRIGAGGGVNVANRRNESEIDRRLQKLWEFLQGEVSEKELLPVDLSTPMLALLTSLRKEQEKGVSPRDSKLPFRAVSVQFRDSGFGSAEFHSHDEEESLASVNDRKQAIDIFLNSIDNLCRKVVLSWNPDSAGGIWGEKWLRTILGGRKPNELIIASGVNAKTVQHVTDWIRKFGR